MMIPEAAAQQQMSMDRRYTLNKIVLHIRIIYK